MATILFRTLNGQKQEVMRFDEYLKPIFQPNFEIMKDTYRMFGIPLQDRTVSYPKMNASEEELKLFKQAMEDLIKSKIEYKGYYWENLTPTLIPKTHPTPTATSAGKTKNWIRRL